MKKKEKKKEVTELNADLNISSNFGQDLKGAKKFGKDMSKILQPLQEQGLIEFKAFTRRICDYCKNELKEGDKFKTIGDKDKCEKCQKAGK